MSVERDIYDDGEYKKGDEHKRVNPLLVRKPTGKPKPSCYDLPPNEFVYGKVDRGDDEGAREVVNSWHEHRPDPAPQPGKNFVKLNQSAIISGSITSKDFGTFRQENDIRLRQGPPPRPKDSVTPNNFTTYGKPSNYTTGVGELLTNTYQRQWIESHRSELQKEKQDNINSNLLKNSLKIEKARDIKDAFSSLPMHTKASLGHHKVKEDEQKEMFKMEKFKKVSGKVQKRLEEEEKEMQLKATQRAARMKEKEDQKELSPKQQNNRSHIISSSHGNYGNNGDPSHTIFHDNGKRRDSRTPAPFQHQAHTLTQAIPPASSPTQQSLPVKPPSPLLNAGHNVMGTRPDNTK